MLDDPERTSRLLAALKASLPFEVHLTPPLARLLREEQVALAARDRQTVSEVSYLGDEGGIVCHLERGGDEKGKLIVTSITHLEFDPRLPFAREIAAYQKHRTKRLRRIHQSSTAGIR